ncbi:Kelch repeat protein [Aspergillus aculeatinus CBS 121060]|uniref:Kelch repeat-containing protein n=1 Tax=Aspergillus aculeatinus CBS 121060 TaxID=1448322 RepID=A0ACD1H859_9EURO|nr:kelch repeat-containing protein [Aspergillus aculeatinus CBS 121060]RAH69775.1 kelch repeat-containing protein [Aspergillus aculeatinus CBS 121060]
MVRATWTQLLSDTATSIQRSSQTLTILGDHAYIYGGELRPREPVDSTVYRLAVSPTSPTIPTPTSTAHPHPQPRVGTASTALANKLYIFSGRGGAAMAPLEEHGALWVFDSTDSVWTQLTPSDPAAPFPVGRSYHALTTNGTDTIYLHAGCPAAGRLRDLWAFDLPTRRWRECAPAPGPARGGASIAYADGKVYRMNGFDGTREQGGAVDVYDPVADVWSTVGFVADGVVGPAARSVGCLLAARAELGRWVLVTLFGECDPSSLGHQGAGVMLGDVWVFDLEAGKWVLVQGEGEGEGDGHRPVARGWFAADVLEGGGSGVSVVVHGGLAESNERSGDVWRLDLDLEGLA